MSRTFWWVAVSLLSSACVSTAPVVLPPDEWATWTEPVTPPEDPVGARLASRAATLVGLGSLRGVTTAVPDDCSGLVRYLYGLEGLDLLEPVRGSNSNASAAIWSAAIAIDAVAIGTLAPGDLVFFRQTWDRNHNGRLDDGLTHIAIVESVDGEGTITFIHRSGQGVTRARMNLAQPHQREINDFLRPAGAHWGPALASELYAGAASAQRIQLGLRKR